MSLQSTDYCRQIFLWNYMIFLVLPQLVFTDFTPLHHLLSLYRLILIFYTLSPNTGNEILGFRGFILVDISLEFPCSL